MFLFYQKKSLHSPDIHKFVLSSPFFHMLVIPEFIGHTETDIETWSIDKVLCEEYFHR